jgi:hypothetical protein
MNKHTPGPWTVEIGRDKPEEQGGKPVLHMILALERLNGSYYVAEIESLADNVDANAQLIAAAPELLAALNFVEPYLTSAMGLDQALEAIAKATGRKEK